MANGVPAGGLRRGLKDDLLILHWNRDFQFLNHHPFNRHLDSLLNIPVDDLFDNLLHRDLDPTLYLYPFFDNLLLNLGFRKKVSPHQGAH